MIQQTAEIRWWSENDQLFHSRLKGLFNRYRNQVEERTDLYLRSKRKNTGIKLRAGRLELKWMKRWEQFTEGRCEYYSKETLESNVDVDNLFLSDWIKVRKSRKQIFFEFRDGLLQPVHEEQKEGCSIEIAKVEISENKCYYTSCFEASSYSGKEKEILLKALVMMEGAPFSEKPSCGYAQFLAEHD